MTFFKLSDPTDASALVLIASFLGCTLGFEVAAGVLSLFSSLRPYW